MHNPNFPVTAKLNRAGHLEVGGCDVVSLAEEFGTPLYVIDETDLRQRCKQYRSSFSSRYDDTEVVYACKALCTTGILRVVADEGLGADVVSGGELFTALRAGVNPKKIYFHGNNKSKGEIEEAVGSGVGRIVIDNVGEIEAVDAAATARGRRQDVLVRINPGIEAHTHEFIRTGQTDSKFGIARDQAVAAVSRISGTKNVNFIGFHAHIGSQIFDVRSFAAGADVLLEMARQVRDQLGINVSELNVGGGLGIDYLERAEAPAIDALAEAITSRVKEAVKRTKIEPPRLVIEPGRSIVGTAGITLYTIGAIKDIPGVRKYVMVDGGMSDNPRPILYQARYDAVIGNKAGTSRNEKVTVAGRFCESGDVLIRDVMLQKQAVGDVLVVFCTGAYNYSMSSNYNRVPRPAMVLAESGSASVIVGRETYDDLVSKDVIV